ncbi:nuclear transport factor 2 family protein [Lentzea sp. NPDC042327]|uniref:nuclear transport factor 2 family protein n=1 Tax=Lentzea sp. NPDC042327 TaxID=3154801 RepID=UPI0033D2B98D
MTGAGAVEERLALRELADRYAQAVDRGRQDLFAELFCAGAHMSLPHPKGSHRPNLVFDSADGWAKLWSARPPWVGSTHLTGNQVMAVAGDEATGETYCLAHELYERGDGLRMVTRSVRYLDVCRRESGSWRFHSRELVIDWSDERPLRKPSHEPRGGRS